MCPDASHLHARRVTRGSRAVAGGPHGDRELGAAGLLLLFFHSMSSTLVRSMYPSQQTVSSPNSPAETVRVAPYLTHLTTHHGQLTLIPPQNAGRIRKTKKKHPPERSKQDRRNANEEPRFTTSVPPSSSRRLQPASSPTRSRKQATVPQTPRTCDSRLDGKLRIAYEEHCLTYGSVLEFPVPDYPPPSFQEAISSPSPYFLAPPTPEHATSAPLMTPQSINLQPVIYAQPASLAPPSHALQHSPARSALFPTLPQSEHAQPDTGMSASDSDSDSDESSLEIVSLEPYEIDRSLAAGPHDGALHEYTRRQATASTTTFTLSRTPKPSLLNYTTVPTTPVSRLRSCSHCGSVRPLDGDAHEFIDSDEERDGVSLDGPSIGLSTRAKRTHVRNLLDTASAPSSPSSASPTTFASMSNPWASSVSLSFGSVFSANKSSQPSSSAVSLKKKETSGIRKLFFVKGKEREAKDRSSADFDSWEIIDSTAVAPASPTGCHNQCQANSSSFEHGGNASPSPLLAFVNRPLRRYDQAQVSPFPPATSLPPPPPPPEKTPLPIARSSDSQPRKSRRPPPPPPPRKAGQSIPSSPSVMWKPNANAERELASQHQHNHTHVDTTVPSDESSSNRSPQPSPTNYKPVAHLTVDGMSSRGWLPTTETRPALDTGALTTEQMQKQAAPHSRSESLSVTLAIPAVEKPNILLACRTEAPPASIVFVSSATPSTPTTPTSASGHHYPGRPLPRPPGPPSPSITIPATIVKVSSPAEHEERTRSTGCGNAPNGLMAEQYPHLHELTNTLSLEDHSPDDDAIDDEVRPLVVPSSIDMEPRMGATRILRDQIQRDLVRHTPSPHQVHRLQRS